MTAVPKPASAALGRVTEGLVVAVLIPCLNEARTVANVISDAHSALPGCHVYVYDNASTDNTAGIAREAGATVRAESRRGKGNVVRRMFSDVDADIYVLIDGDGTYSFASVPSMIQDLLRLQLDMVTGKRVPASGKAYRTGHEAGNRALTAVIRKLFGAGCDDVFSGLRVMTRRFVKSFPALSRGFEIETDLTVHALALRVPMTDFPVEYFERPRGSTSKLKTFTDGRKIVLRLVTLFRVERPFIFYGALGVVGCSAALILGGVLLEEFARTGLVARFPTAILATGLMLSGFISIVCGVILQALARFRHESLRLRYLGIPCLGGRDDQGS